MTFGEYQEREFNFESKKAYEYHNLRLLMSAIYCGQVEKVPKLKEIIYIPLFDYEEPVTQEDIKEYKRNMPTLEQFMQGWNRK